MTHVYRKCYKCGATQASNPELRMHRFPALGQSNENFYQLLSWAMFCDSDKDWFNLQAIRGLQQSGKVLCSRHFDDSCYTTSARIRLRKNAVPLTIDENKENRDTPTPGPSHEYKSNVLVDHGQIIPLQRGIPGSLLRTKETTVLQTQKEHNVKSTESKIYNKYKYLLKKVRKLKIELQSRKSIDILQTLHGNEDVTKLFGLKISSSMALLLQGELQNGQRRLRGRRWTENQKFLALELYKKSPRMYKLLNRLFCLPDPSTLRKLLGKFILNPGINDIIFDNIKNRAKKNTDVDNLCILTFDEMSIMKNINYNSKYDTIEGYQDHGHQGKCQVFASHALVFMIVWIRQKRKQPVAYYLSGDYVTADRLTALIKEVLHKCLQSTIAVCATVCDMDGVNVRALENLGSSVDHPYFKFDGHEIITLPDPPHLLKCFRNLFLKYDVKLPLPVENSNQPSTSTTPATGVASWKHIEHFYELDNANPHFVFAPKLSKRHLQPNGKEKMRVKLASQIFSHSVAMGIFSKAATNELPSGAIATATFLEHFNNLFDLLNANSADRESGKPYKTNWTSKSPHGEFIKKSKFIINNLEFIECKRTPPSKTGWLKLLNGYERLWEMLNKKYNIKTLSTRRINQDPLENCFGCIRANCGSNDNPTVSQFVAGLKTSIVTNMRSVCGSNRNCEEDENDLMENFKYIFNNNQSKKNIDNTVITDSPLPLPDMAVSGHEICDEDIETSAETQACAYVCGFIFKKYARNCVLCKKAMLAETPTNIHNFISFKEYVDGKHSLQYANVKFVACVEKCAEVINEYLINSPHTDRVKNNCISKIKNNVNFDFLNECPEHLQFNRDMIEQSTTIIIIKRFCILQNRKFAEERSKKLLEKKIKILKNC